MMARMKFSYLAWANSMDYYRLIIMAGMILIQGCIMAPITLISVNAAGMNSIQLFLLLGATFGFLVMTLADQPMRRTIPVFIAGIVVQLALILVNGLA